MKKIILIITIILGFIFLNKKLNIKQSLAKKFNDAYSESVRSNGNIFELNLDASKSAILIDENEIDMWTYNNQYPGPEIRLKLGDSLKINFTNNLPQETTIHFHGIRVPNAMDGVPGVTQPPVKTGESFLYEFTPKDTGTYWYHPHVRGSEQIERGLIGTIIVEDPKEPKYDKDQVIVLDDILLDDDVEIYNVFNTPHDLMHDGRWGNNILVNGSSNSQYKVNPGERIRLRFVNTSNGRVYKLDFDNLDAKGFAVDGLLASETFDPNGFELAPGNRLEVDISIPLLSTDKNYYITDDFTRDTNKLITLIPTDKIAETKDFSTPIASSHPQWQQAKNAKIDHEYVLDARRAMGMGARMGMSIEWTINGKTFEESDPITLKAGEFNKLKFTNNSARLHPMHLHGLFFKVVTRNGKVVEETYFRDTVLIYPEETVEIGLIPLDKGEWANHCHILEHAESGMMTTIKVE